MITCESHSFYDDMADSVGVEEGKRREWQAFTQLLGISKDLLSSQQPLSRRYTLVETHKWGGIVMNVKIQLSITIPCIEPWSWKHCMSH